MWLFLIIIFSYLTLFHMKKFLLLFLSLFILTSGVASAVTLEAGENVVVTTNILDDAYIVGGNANIEADIFGDLYIAGGTVTINAKIHEDLVVAGGRVTVLGDVLGDLRVIGGQVAIYGNVGDDVVAIGGQVDIGKGSVVGGSVLSGAGILTVDGEIEEDIRGGMGMLLLNGVVGKDVIVTIEDTINVSENAKILGDLKYSALLEANIPDDVVSGEILFNKFEEESVLENITYAFFIWKILSFLSALILAGILVLLAPKALIKATKITNDNILKTFGVGLLTMIVAIIGAIVLMVTVVGVPVGLIIFAMLLMAIYFAKVFVAAWLTGYVFNYKKKISRWKLFGGVALAMLAYYIVGVIPYVGWVVNLILFLIGIGAMVLLKIEYFKFMKEKGMV